MGILILNEQIWKTNKYIYSSSHNFYIRGGFDKSPLCTYSLFFTANAALANFTFREVQGNTMQVYKLWQKSFGHNEIQFIASLTVCWLSYTD